MAPTPGRDHRYAYDHGEHGCAGTTQDQWRPSPGLKVLFASGYTDDLVLQDRFATQDAVLVQKPYTNRVLSHKVRAVLDS